MGSDNIFSIWRYVGKQTPFIVRRNGWYHLSYKVTKVVPKGQYGVALGYELHDGIQDDKTAEEPIGCCGCGGWELTEDLVEDVNKRVWNCLDEDGNINFGKYKGQKPEIAFAKDEEYANWACDNVGGLCDLIFVRTYKTSLQELDTIKKQIKSKLRFTSDDWIKSTVPENFDFCLDILKRDIFLKKLTLDEASNKLNSYYKEHGQH